MKKDGTAAYAGNEPVVSIMLRTGSWLLALYLTVALYHILSRVGIYGVMLGLVMMSVLFYVSRLATQSYLLVMIGLACLLSFWWGLSADVHQVWDFEAFYRHASMFGWQASWKWLAVSKSPATIVVYGMGYKLLNVSLYSTYIIGALLWGGQAWLLYKVCLELGMGARHAFLASLIYLFIPSTILYAPVISSESTFLLFMILAFLIFIKVTKAAGRRELYLVATLGAVFGFMHISRSLGGLFFLITIFVLLIFWIGRMRPAQLAARLFILVAGFSVGILPKVYANYQHTGVLAVSSHPAGWYLLATGTNRDSNGRYSVADWKNLGFASGDLDKANKAAREVVERRIFRDPLGFLIFAMNGKMDVLWGSDYAGWEKSTGGSPFLQEMTDSKLKSLMIKVADSYQVVVVALGLIGLVVLAWHRGGQRGIGWPFVLAVLFCLATGLLHVFIEVQARYHYPFMPMLSVLASVTIFSFISGISARARANGGGQAG